MKYILLIFSFFLSFSQIIAQQIFNEGELHFRNGQRAKALILEDSYLNYQKGVTYKLTVKDTLHKAVYKDLISFTIGKNQKFVASQITDKKFASTTSYQYSVFLKQLEEGRLNLYEYNNEYKTKWLFIQKADNALQKLYVIRKDFASQAPGALPVKIDTLSTTQSPDAGFFRLEKKFKVTLRDATKDASNLKIPEDLLVKRIRKFVLSYNKKQQHIHQPISYFNEKAGFRVFLTGSYFPINKDRTHSTGTFGEEIEFLFNSERKRTTLSIGFVHRAKVGKNRINLPNTPSDQITDIRMSQFYLRGNSYFNIQNQLKPFFFGGIKLVYPSKGKSTYDLVSNNSSFERGSNLFALFNLGIGTLYELNNGLLIKGEIGTRLFPDFKIGIGWKLK